MACPGGQHRTATDCRGRDFRVTSCTLTAVLDPRETPDGRPSLQRPAFAVPAPPGRFGLSLDHGGALASLGPARLVGTFAAAAGVAALYVWDDLIFAAPVVAAASVWGPLRAWLVFAVLYAVLSFPLAIAAARMHDRATGGEAGRFARWLESQGAGRRGSWGRALINGGQALGFVLASFLLGGILTTWLTRVVRPDQPTLPVAAASCTIFGITFVAQYAGIAALVL